MKMVLGLVFVGCVVGVGLSFARGDASGADAESKWIYTSDPYEMGHGTVLGARLESVNKIELSFPYQGKQNGYLVVRSHPKEGTDVMFYVLRGQFSCSTFNGCDVLVRFDDKEAESFEVGTPQGNAMDTIFIEDESRFIEKMRQAKRVRISAVFFRDGQRMFEFDVRGFDKSRATETTYAPVSR